MKIKYVNKPKNPDGKFGNIKGDDGDTYFVNVACLGKYSVGMEIDPPFENQKWGQNVVKVIPPHFDPANGNAPPAAQAPQRAPQTNSNGQTKDAAMFVMGVVGRAMGSGKFDTQDIPLLAKAAAAAWNEVKGSL